MDGGGDHCPLRLCRACPERPEAHLCLLLDQSSRLLPAGNFCGSEVHWRRYGAYCREVCSNEWRFPADVQSCTDCLSSVLVCRHAGKTQRRVARPGRFWRTAQGRACFYRTDGHRLVLHVGTAWPEWIYRGVPDLQRIVSAGDLGHFAFRPRTACHGNLYSWNSAARFLRAAQ